MPSEKQINANRRNAHKSTGPKTAKGKSIASRNSIKHGLLARQSTITGESKAKFDRHCDRIFAEYDPTEPTDIALTERIVILTWQLKRVNRFQTAAINALHNSYKTSAVRGLDAILKPKKDNAPPPPDLDIGMITVKDFANSRVIDRLGMHERRIENSLYKTIQELQRNRLMRKIGI